MRKQIILTIIWAFSEFLAISPWVDKAYTRHSNENAYEQQEISFDLCVQQKQQNRDAIHDSLVAAWIAANDTALREFEKTVKVPHTYCAGRWKPTGRLECEPSYSGKMICRPESAYVKTNNCDTYYTKDTVWSKGWASRDEWVLKANHDAQDKLGHAIHALCRAEFPYFKAGDGPNKTIYSTLGILDLDDWTEFNNDHPYITTIILLIAALGIPWAMWSPFIILPLIWGKMRWRER